MKAEGRLHVNIRVLKIIIRDMSLHTSLNIRKHMLIAMEAHRL